MRTAAATVAIVLALLAVCVQFERTRPASAPNAAARLAVLEGVQEHQGYNLRAVYACVREIEHGSAYSPVMFAQCVEDFQDANPYRGPRAG